MLQENLGRQNVFIDEDVFEIVNSKVKETLATKENPFLPLSMTTTKITRAALMEANRVYRLNLFVIRLKPVIEQGRVCLNLAYKLFTDGISLFDPENQMGRIFFDRAASSFTGEEPCLSRTDTEALFISILNTVPMHAQPLAIAATQNLVDKVLKFKKMDSFELPVHLLGIKVKVTQHSGAESTTTSTSLQVYFTAFIFFKIE